MASACCLFATAAAAADQQPATEPVFHAGTRLVEVNVVVRNKPVRPPGIAGALRYWFDTGPPFGPTGASVTGLTKDDFTVFDQGKPQPIAVFSTGNAGDPKSPALPPGAFSNRADNGGQSLNGATVVLVDLLNTPFDLTDYARTALKQILRSLDPNNTRIALFTLGEKLHTLHDFSDDPRELADVAGALRDFGDIMGLEGGGDYAAERHGRITYTALKRIVQHLSGLPGRKNLIWLMSSPQVVPPAVMAMVQQANIVLYPVLVRGAGAIFLQDDARALAKVTGATAFFDARDLTFAIQSATEDSGGAYTLGYYPSEGSLDGGFHRIAVRIDPAKLDPAAYEIHYRTGYLATKVAPPPQPQTMADLFGSSLNASGIGLTAQAAQATDHPNLYDVRLTVDLRDIHLEHKEGHSTGAFYFAVPDPSIEGNIRTGVVNVDLTDQQLADKLESGFHLLAEGVTPDSGEIRLVVRDRATGAAGSLRIPVAPQ